MLLNAGCGNNGWRASDPGVRSGTRLELQSGILVQRVGAQLRPGAIVGMPLEERK
jgi:hypothetical protein